MIQELVVVFRAAVYNQLDTYQMPFFLFYWLLISIWKSYDSLVEIYDFRNGSGCLIYFIIDYGRIYASHDSL